MAGKFTEKEVKETKVLVSMKINLFACRRMMGILAGAVFMIGNAMAQRTDSALPVKPDANKAVSAPAAKASLVFLGDSHTENGIYAQTAFDFLSKAGAATEKYRCYGWGGKTAGDLIGFIDAGTIDLSTDPKAENIAIIMIGTNGYDIDTLKRLVGIVSKRGFKVLVLTTPPRRGADTNSGAGGPGSNAGYNTSVRSTYPAIKPGLLQPVQVLDIVPALLDPEIPVGRGEWTNPKYNGDNVHLNKDGYVLIGELVGKALLASLSVKPDTTESETPK